MCLAHRKSSVLLQSYQSAQLIAWDYPTPVNHLSSGHGLRQHKSAQASHTRIFNLWRGTAHNPLLGQGPGVPSLGTSPCYKDSPDKGMSTMYNMIQSPVLAGQQAPREQFTPHIWGNPQQMNANSHLPLMGHIPPPQPQPPRTVGLCLRPFRFRHTAAPRFPMYSCSAEGQPQCLTPVTLQSQIECSFL